MVFISLHEQKVLQAQPCPWQTNASGTLRRGFKDCLLTVGTMMRVILNWVQNLRYLCIGSFRASTDITGFVVRIKNLSLSLQYIKKGQWHSGGLPSEEYALNLNGLVAFMAEHCHKETFISINNYKEVYLRNIVPKTHLQKEPEKGTKWKANSLSSIFKTLIFGGSCQRKKKKIRWKYLGHIMKVCEPGWNFSCFY